MPHIKMGNLSRSSLKLYGSMKKTPLFTCIYRHPSMSVKEFNNDYFTPLLYKASSENKLLFRTGDFNVDLLKA